MNDRAPRAGDCIRRPGHRKWFHVVSVRDDGWMDTKTPEGLDHLSPPDAWEIVAQGAIPPRRVGINVKGHVVYVNSPHAVAVMEFGTDPDTGDYARIVRP